MPDRRLTEGPEDFSLQTYLDWHGIKHFKAREIDPRGMAPRYLWANCVSVCRLAEKLREEFGPTMVSSGYRNSRYNQIVGGADDSMHLYFCALDLKPQRGTPRKWRAFFRRQRLSGIMGIGVYKTFIHIDTRVLLGRPLWDG